jgi:hypothetical protein
MAMTDDEGGLVVGLPATPASADGETKEAVEKKETVTGFGRMFHRTKFVFELCSRVDCNRGQFPHRLHIQISSSINQG